jgi:predicted PurR-regulated permease PerM
MATNSNDNPRLSATTEPHSAAGTSLRDRAGGIIAFGIVLMLLYFGRDVLIPLTLALMLSLLIAPLVRVLRRIGVGQTLSVLAAVLALAIAVAAIAIVLGTQVLRMAASLPEYQETIQQKLQNLDELTLGRLNTLTSEANRLIARHSVTSPTPPTSQVLQQSSEPQAVTPVPVEVREPRSDPFQILAKILAAIWIPTQTTGIVLIVLVFVLLEHEALRDRFIRLAGGTNIRSTTLALNDAGERLSRFFVSQFAVNLGVGATLGLGLALLGLPHAMLWGTLAAALRFVPYVGVWIAAIFATALAVAVVPGWALAVVTFGLFVGVEVIAAQVVEPQLYGHATGLSPLSVVVAAIFWSAIWGPMGLILSTPLTLCLVVGGRHIKALHFLDLLLGDTQALTLPQKFYQRALSGDSQEIIANARAFLKNNTFAEYCDRVLVPALHLSRLDYEMGAIGPDQQARIRAVVVQVVSRLDGADPVSSPRRRPGSVLDPHPGRTLREQRERHTGKWQGPVTVAPGSVMVCLALGALADDLATELLVRILRNQKQDARHFSVQDADVATPPETATPGAVAIVYLVSAFPSAERDKADAVAERVRQILPGALLVNVFLPGLTATADFMADRGSADHAVTSFVEAARICLERQQPPPP